MVQGHANFPEDVALEGETSSGRPCCRAQEMRHNGVGRVVVGLGRTRRRVRGIGVQGIRGRAQCSARNCTVP